MGACNTGHHNSFEKDSTDGIELGKGLAWATSCMQGRRAEMEDAHIARGSLASSGTWHDIAIFGVLDGHGGEEVACFCKDHLPTEITRGSSSQLQASLVRAFHRMDDMLSSPNCSIADEMGGRAGSTAVISCISPMFITTANVGDSRAVLCRNGIAVALSQDHKPFLQAELIRITNAGGWVGPSGRINGKLAVSRAIGDFAYKQNRSISRDEQIVSGTPDVLVVERREDDEFMIIACDGVWDVLTSQEAVNVIRKCLGERHRAWRRVINRQIELSAAVEVLFDHCTESSDNLTAILVLFEDSPGKKERERVVKEDTDEWDHAAPEDTDESLDDIADQSDDDITPVLAHRGAGAKHSCF